MGCVAIGVSCGRKHKVFSRFVHTRTSVMICMCRLYSGLLILVTVDLAWDV